MKELNLYRKFDGNTPWKDWAIGSDPDTNKLIVWFGRTGGRMQMREIDLKGEDIEAVRDKRVTEQTLRDGYVYQGKCKIKNGYIVMTRSLGEELADAEIEDDPTIKAYWILSGDANETLTQLRSLASRLDNWIMGIRQDNQVVRLELANYPSWELDLTQDGRHNQGRIDEAYGPVPLLLMLRLARDQRVQMARVDGTEITANRLGTDLSLLDYDGVGQDEIIRIAEQIGLIMPQLWALDLQSNDCWL